MDSWPGEARPELLLATKLRIPPVRRDLVGRARLLMAVEQGLQRKLLLLSAPAGFGKTTLLSVALAEHARPGAWVSLDSGDNDPAQFWAYVLAALDRLHAGIAATARRILQAPLAPPIETVLTLVLNRLTELQQDVTLVLDDYHVIDAEPIHRGVQFLLDHLPAHLHLVIAGRADPPLPLARLRAIGELAELRTRDLRFTHEEATVFLNEVMGLALAPAAVASLEARTEGWIAGLHLAALSLQGHSDATGFIEGLSGSHRYILDYLLEEVVERLPEQVQHFLLQTSILDRFSAPLCEAVTGERDGRAMLRQIEQANLFIIPLDEERQWFRYHHLFATLLSGRLREEQPEQISALHRRASAWLARHGLIVEAAEQAIAGEDWEGVTQLLEQHAEPLVLRGQGATLLAWLAAVPDNLLGMRPRLGLAHAWALVFTNHLDLAAQRAAVVEHALEGIAETADVQGMRAEVIAIQATIAAQKRDAPRTIALSQEALDTLPADNPHRAALALNLGYAYGTLGDAAAARRAFVEAATAGKTQGNLLVTVIGLTNAGHIDMLQGHLQRAADVFRRALQLAAENDGQALPITGVTYSCLGALLCEWNDLEAAERYLIEGAERTRQTGSVIAHISGALRLVRLKQARGDVEGALDVIREVEQDLPASQGAISPAHLAAYRARLWLAKGNVAAAARWAEETGLGSDDELRFEREPEYMVLARLLIAQRKLDQAAQLLARLEQTAEARQRLTSLLTILVLRALVFEAQRKQREAWAVLARALSLAEPEGYIRVFVDEGPPVLTLLLRLLETPPEQLPDAPVASSDYIRKLIAAFGGQALDDPAAPTLPSVEALVEPLTAREIEVLRLVAAGHSNHEIARSLIVSLATVKTHINNIYGKLAVRSRTQAVARARELNLLA